MDYLFEIHYHKSPFGTDGYYFSIDLRGGPKNYQIYQSNPYSDSYETPDLAIKAAENLIVKVFQRMFQMEIAGQFDSLQGLISE